MLEKLKGYTVGQLIDTVTALPKMLDGWKTYLMIVITVVDQIGAQKGLWAADQLRELIEIALGAAALRAGVGK